MTYQITKIKILGLEQWELRINGTLLNVYWSKDKAIITANSIKQRITSK